MNTRRDFFKDLIIMSLLFPILGNAKKISNKKVFIVGGHENFLIIYDMNEKVTRKIPIYFKGHSYIQNPFNPKQIIITQREGGNWCVYDLAINKIIKSFNNPNYLFYGHIVFAENGMRFYRPRAIGKKDVALEIVDSRNYQVIEVIPFDSKALHQVQIVQGTNNIVLASVGHHNLKGEKEDGLLVLNLDERKVIKSIKIESEGLYPTHLLSLKNERYIVSTESPLGEEKKLHIKMDKNGKRDFKGGLHDVNIGNSATSKKIIFSKALDEKLKNNISNFIFEEKNNLIYFEDIGGSTIFSLNADSLEYVADYPIRSHGIFLYNDKIYVTSNENKKFDKFISIYDLCKEYLINTHFSIVEV